MKKLIYCFMSVLFVVSFASANDPPDGLVAYYPFNGDANNQAADVGHGTVVGAVLTEDRNGNPNSAYLFSGERGVYVEILDTDLVLPVGNEPRTLAMWARCDSLNLQDGHIIAYGTQSDGQHCHLSMHAYDGFIRMGFWYNDIDAYVDLFDPIWHHIAGVWDGKKVRIYFDGVLKENIAPPNPVNTIPHETIYLRIGCQNSANNDNEFNGAIDEVMIFSRALDDNEITAIMDYNTQIDDETHMQVSSFKLYQNTPNPFNPTTTIHYSLPKRDFVTLKVYDCLGKELQTLISESVDGGNHSITFDASNLPSGLYFCRLQAGDLVETRKMVVMK